MQITSTSLSFPVLFKGDFERNCAFYTLTWAHSHLLKLVTVFDLNEWSSQVMQDFDKQNVSLLCSNYVVMLKRNCWSKWKRVAFNLQIWIQINQAAVPSHSLLIVLNGNNYQRHMCSAREWLQLQSPSGHMHSQLINPNSKWHWQLFNASPASAP